MSNENLTLIAFSVAILLNVIWICWDIFQLSKAESGKGSIRQSIEWAIGTVLLWVLVFPVYFFVRAKRIRALRASGQQWEQGGAAMALVLLCVAVAAGVGVWSSLHGPSVPACEEAPTLELAKSIVQDLLYKDAPNVKQDFRLDVKSVTSEGFNSDAKRWTCNASVRVTAPKPLLGEMIELQRAVSNQDLQRQWAILAWDASPQKAKMERGYFDVDVGYASTIELKSKRQLVQLKMQGGESEVLSQYMSLVNRVAALPIPSAPKTQAPADAALVPAAGHAMFQVKQVVQCGEEALCVTTAAGETLTTNFFALDEAARGMLHDAAREGSALCFFGLGEPGQDRTFEGIKPRCE